MALLRLLHKSKTPSESKQQSSRLLNLPGEIRNRIYSYISADLDDPSNPVVVWVNRPPERPKSKTLDMQQRLGLRRKPEIVTRLTILQICRQMRIEAFQYVCDIVQVGGMGSHRSKALSIVMNELLPSRLATSLITFQKCFGPGLRFVRQLRLVGQEALVYLIVVGRVYWDDDRGSDCFGPWKLQYNSALALFRALSNVEAITVTVNAPALLTLPRDYPLWDKYMRMRSYVLVAEDRQMLQKMFPRLHDIKCESSFFSERFRLADGGDFYHWYSREKINET